MGIRIKFNIPKKSLLFAPMEGVTDEVYRLGLISAFPEWDRYYTDFLRVPTIGKYQNSRIRGHFGHQVLESEELGQKTVFQLLTTKKANTIDTLNQLNELGISHLDLNLGCPSRTVNLHGGGAYLLSDHESLEFVIRTIRKNFSNIFTAKIRVGYRDDKNFEDTLRLLQNEGVDAITVHARTRDELYKGVANWDYIKKAVETVSIPIIGNGDAWTTKDIEDMFTYTGCHSVMVGRGALKTPWLAYLFKNQIQETPALRVEMIKKYFFTLHRVYKENSFTDKYLLKKYKVISRYIFDDLENKEEFKKELFRAQDIITLLNFIKSLS